MYYYRLDLKALLERKPAKISCDDKVGNQTGYKKKKKEEEEYKKKNEIDSQKSPKLLYTDTPKTEEEDRLAIAQSNSPHLLYAVFNGIRPL